MLRAFQTQLNFECNPLNKQLPIKNVFNIDKIFFCKHLKFKC